MKDSERVSLASLLPHIKTEDLRNLMAYISASWFAEESGLVEELEKRDGELQVQQNVDGSDDGSLSELPRDLFDHEEF